MSKNEILTHAAKISAKTDELKANEEYKKYNDLQLRGISREEKDYIKTLEDMETKLLGEEDKKQIYIIEIKEVEEQLLQYLKYNVLVLSIK